ncbi:MAG: antitoxin VapB family protein [Candidatus Heimdallarchaeota archaeon]
MGSKTISVTDEVYGTLKRVQLPGESFGDTIMRLCRTYSTDNLLKWIQQDDGWRNMSEEEFEEFLRPIKTFRQEYQPYMENSD